jgi:hypothetical protein
MVALPRVALRRALPSHNLKLLDDSRDAILNAAAVSFQLRFTFTAAHANPAFLPRQVAPESGQSRQQVLQLRELNLQLAFFGAGALGENIQDQRRPIENLAIEDLLQIAALRGRKFVVKNDRIHIRAPTVLGKFIRLAFADESRRARRGQLLDSISNDLPSGSGCQFGKFLQRIAGIPAVSGF